VGLKGKMENKTIQDILEIIKDHQQDKTPIYKDYEDTYMDGWLDACNQILWSVQELIDKK
jgi:hypothetical protein